MENVEQLEQEFKPFNQIPTWKADSDFVIKGNEFEALYNFINIFMPATTALQAVFERSIQSGVVTISNEYADGSGEVPKEVLESYMTKLQEAVQKQIEESKPKTKE